MASLVLGVAGAAIGGAVGGPLGAKIGFALGSALGNLLDPPKIEGPRLDDLKLQDSAYGNVIPVVYGTMRVPGNVIWQTDLIENAQTSGGKGGPEVTNYTYSASFAVMLCEGPIIGVSKVWADGRVVWDTTSGSTSTFQFTLYTGTETQLPDPTMEAEIGVGDVPAHRGYAYAVFDSLPLEEYYNRIPSLEWEVFTNAGDIPWRVSTFSPWTNTSTNQLGGATYDNGVVTTTEIDDSATNPVDYILRRFLVDGTQQGSTQTQTFALSQKATVRNLNSVVMYYNDAGGSVANWYTPDNTGTLNAGPVITPEAMTAPNDISGNASIYCGDYIYSVGAQVGTTAINRYQAPGGVPGLSAGYVYLDDDYNVSDVFLGSSDTGHVYVLTGAYQACKMWKFDQDLNLIHFWDVVDTDHTRLTGRGNFHVYNGYICFNYATGTTPAFVIALVTINGTTLADHPTTLPHTDKWVGNLSGGLMIDYDGIFSLDPPAGPVLLSDIVADLSDRSDLAGQYDVSDLTDLVLGYKVAQQMTTRNAIEPLRAAYHFDAVEQDTEAVFVKRGGASIVTIDAGYVAAREYGNAAPAVLETTRATEDELPREVSVDFIDATTDHQTATQLAERQITTSTSVTTLDLPISLSQSEGRQIANIRLFEAWYERERFKFTTSRKYAKYVPTDVITLGTRVMRLVDKTETPSGVITFTGVLSNADIYTQPAIGVPAGGFVTTTPPSGTGAATVMELFDIPLVQDSDLPHGFYVAMGPATTGTWPGASLYRSLDGGTTYTSVATVLTEDTMGTATTKLPDFYGGNVFDEHSTVTVLLTSGTLSSATEAAVLNGANMAVLGLEIFQFKTATLTATDTYQLSGLLRGRRGTESATQAHTIGDRFAMLPLTNVDTPVNNLFQSLLYKPVTIGTTVASATAESFANMGMASRPYAPVDVGGGVDGSGNLTIEWTRRTRIGGAWLDFVDVPLGEQTEEYVVQIWDSTYTDCARIIQGITSETTTYTAAQQVTDFGATQSTIYVTVGQLGAYMLGEQTRAALPGGGAVVSSVIAPVTAYNASPTPPPGGSGGSVNQAISGYPSDQITTSGYVVGDTYVASFTTNGSPVPNRISVAEYQDPPTFRHVLLCADVNGNTVLAEGWGVGVSLFYTPAATTTYYIIIRVELPWGGTGRPLGEGADMVISLQPS